MHPDRTSFGNRPLPAGAARHEIVETQMTELVAAIDAEDYIAAGRSGDQGAQRFEPADEPTATLRGRLPPRAARRHDDDRWPGAILTRDYDHDIARMGPCPAARGDQPRRCPPSGGGEHRVARLARDMNRRCAVGIAKPLGVQQPEARVCAVAEDDETAMRWVAAQLLVFWGVD